MASENDCIYVTCPHCDGTVEVLRSQFNCMIFRHGTYKANNNPIPPHLDKASCDQLAIEDKIYGCGKPFKLSIETINEDIINNDTIDTTDIVDSTVDATRSIEKITAVICDYI